MNDKFLGLSGTCWGASEQLFLAVLVALFLLTIAIFGICIMVQKIREKIAISKLPGIDKQRLKEADRQMFKQKFKETIIAMLGSIGVTLILFAIIWIIASALKSTGHCA